MDERVLLHILERDSVVTNSVAAVYWEASSIQASQVSYFLFRTSLGSQDHPASLTRWIPKSFPRIPTRLVLRMWSFYDGDRCFVAQSWITGEIVEVQK